MLHPEKVVMMRNIVQPNVGKICFATVHTPQLGTGTQLVPVCFAIKNYINIILYILYLLYILKMVLRTLFRTSISN
jgi:hypothetical protein